MQWIGAFLPFRGSMPPRVPAHWSSTTGLFLDNDGAFDLLAFWTALRPWPNSPLQVTFFQADKTFHVRAFNFLSEFFSFLCIRPMTLLTSLFWCWPMDFLVPSPSFFSVT